MGAALLIDFGSTYTKLRAVDLGTGAILGAAQGPSTVTTDVNNGLDAALADLEGKLGRLPEFERRLATSSAAGGLRMVTVGLVKELTAEAARRAALGAGAKLVGTFAYRLTDGDIADIAALQPDILLLAGGTDGGNADVILHNAGKLATAAIGGSIIYAGNRSAADDARAALEGGGKIVTVVENVMPEFNELNIEPARAAIRQIFIDRIVQAKGIDRASGRFDQVMMPTPAAVLEGARLLAEGTEEQAGLGELLVVDIGGATTDVHSIARGQPTMDGVVQLGLPEPFQKRTVEGDLGMRHNADIIVETAGVETIARDAGIDAASVGKMLDAIRADVERLPQNDAESGFDLALARAAVKKAVARHAGTHRMVQTVTGPATVQEGKDLSDIKTIIGTGGALVHGRDPARVLKAALADPALPECLMPLRPRLVIDGEYLLYAVGLLAGVRPDAAFMLGSRHLVDLPRDDAQENERVRHVS
ncbi:MAG: methylaspartate mutase accessory protein GlmL [Rhodospirillaceae bacterium]